jgi:hypothetical protein
MEPAFMGSDNPQAQNVIFWGAGATSKLGIRTTSRQEEFVRCITGNGAPSGKSLKERIREALGEKTAQKWHDALRDLITILGDNDAAYGSIHHIEAAQRAVMRRNWVANANDKDLDRRIIELRLIYDWPALKSAVGICPGNDTDRFKLNDLFNLLDMHIAPGSGFRAPAPRIATSGSGEQFLDSRRLIGAKNALLLILIASFYIDYQECISSKQKILKQYYEFAKLLGERMQDQAPGLARKYRLDEPDFYRGDVSFVSLNYDPIALWMQFVVNRELNNSRNVPPTPRGKGPLHLFHDFGHLIPARRIEQPTDSWPWYPLNEAAAQRLNELERQSSPKVRLTKFLFPHGCLCWRECPDCGKLSAFHGDQWKLNSPGLFPPPPLRVFDPKGCANWITDPELKARKKGKVDARKCLHCGTLTYAHHTQVVMQSSFKPRPPSFIEEIQRDLRATTMRASHIIFMGYSLPPDDVTYRAFFSARRQRRELVHCTVVDYEEGYPGWYRAEGLRKLRKKLREQGKESPVNAACDIFGEKMVRFFGGGIPDVFLDRDDATSTKLKQLLDWNSVP